MRRPATDADLRRQVNKWRAKGLDDVAIAVRMMLPYRRVASVPREEDVFPSAPEACAAGAEPVAARPVAAVSAAKTGGHGGTDAVEPLLDYPNRQTAGGREAPGDFSRRKPRERKTRPIAASGPALFTVGCVPITQADIDAGRALNAAILRRMV